MKKSFKTLLVGVVAASLLAACGAEEEPKKETETKETVKALAPGYEKYGAKVAEFEAKFAKYQDVRVAIADGYLPASGFVPLMGYHFSNPEIAAKGTDLETPDTLLYVIDENGDFKFVGIEWSAVGNEKPTKTLFEGASWSLGHEASAHFEDGTEIPVKTPQDSPKTNPETGAAFTEWHPDIWGVHMFLYIESPTGLFAETNTALAPYSNSPTLPPIAELTEEKPVLEDHSGHGVQ